MKKYNQLTIEEREKIQDLLWKRKSIREIAFQLNRSPSTISRELKKNCPPKVRRYTPRLAQEKAIKIRSERAMRPRLKSETIKEYVHKKLKLGWSPEQISGRLSLEHKKHNISHEAIYQYIYSKGRNENDLRKYLRRRHKRRAKRGSQYIMKRGLIKDRIGIEKRPKYIERRVQFGHWEGDSIESRKSKVALNTLVERVSGKVIISKLKNLKADETKDKVIKALEKYPKSLRRTLTVDNGKENAYHEQISKAIQIACYFCNPYHSWEKGINENTNGLIRWYIPKGTDIEKITNDEIKNIELLINSRPRKRLNYKTPDEVFNKNLSKCCT